VTDNLADQIDVQKLVSELGIEGACRTAEDYFAGLERTVLAKPFDSIVEAPRILSCFAQLIHGLDLLPGMTVLDFGAGSCWTSRFLTQLGLKVICLDVSKSALQAGQELYRTQPVFGNQPQPHFLQFNGERIELEDASVDRIFCFDAFHHVPNQAVIIKELSRVLKQGGVAGFSEPGPDHSMSLQAQSEMRLYKVVENDIDIRRLWNYGQEVGFTNLKIAVFNPFAAYVSLEEFETYLKTQKVSSYFEATHTEMLNRRLFFLQKGESPDALDSRQSKGLVAEIEIELLSTCIKDNAPIHARVKVKNIGIAKWLGNTASNNDVLPSSLFDKDGVLLRERLHKGTVHLGVHLHNASAELIERDYYRHALKPNFQSVLPGESVSFEMTMPAPSKGEYILEFDLVSEWICWFEANGSRTIYAKVSVV